LRYSFLVEPYIFNINQFVEQERIPTMNLYPESSSNISREHDQRTISNFDNEMTSQSSILQETKQLLDMISSNQDLDVSKLASEV